MSVEAKPPDSSQPMAPFSVKAQGEVVGVVNLQLGPLVFLDCLEW